jgi:hypothetical protein
MTLVKAPFDPDSYRDHIQRVSGQERQRRIKSGRRKSAKDNFEMGSEIIAELIWLMEKLFVSKSCALNIELTRGILR